MKPRPSGVSLIELIVASAIVILLMVEVWGLVRAGGRFYLRVRSQSDIQRNSLLALRWITKEIGDGSAISFREYTTDGAGGQASTVSRAGIVFGSPTDASGQVHYDERGRLQWSSVIGYYIEPSDRILYRQKLLLPAPQGYPPIINNDLHSTDQLATLPAPRLVARHIHSIETVQGPSDILVKLHTRDQDIGYGITVQTRLEMKN